MDFAEAARLDYELLLVNDSPPDETWTVLREKAGANPRIRALCLMRNYGQHTAVLCGLRQSRGEWVVTLDDDLQNPPAEIRHLIDAAAEGDHDLVMGVYRQKRHPLHRRLGSRLINVVNEKVFGKPKDLRVTNFRLIRRDVVDRICNHRTVFPYVNGLSVMYAVRPANVTVEHRARAVGESNYDLTRILRLVFLILFSYSSYPLQAVAAAGLGMAVLSFLLGAAFLVRGLLVGSAVQGWTSLVTLMAFFNSFVLLLLSMLGEYVMRLQIQITAPQNYVVIDAVGVAE